MKQEDKELLLKDLCARLTYGVKGYADGYISTLEGVNVIDSIVEYDMYCQIVVDEFTPYLFPLSSMTEEQEIIYGDLCYQIINATPFEIQNCIDKLYDWLNKNHFDYRGLIEKGLAIDATGLNIY